MLHVNTIHEFQIANRVICSIFAILFFQIESDSAADKNGRIFVGDQVVQVGLNYPPFIINELKSKY